MDSEESSKIERAIRDLADASRVQSRELSSIRRSITFLAVVAGVLAALWVVAIATSLVAAGCVARTYSVEQGRPPR